MDQPNKPKASAPKIKFSTTLKNGTVKSIEVPAPSSMKSLRVWTFAAGELAIEQDLATLMLLMFREPEATFEYFSEYQQPLDRALSAAIDRGDVLLLKSENYYYKHPRSPRVYLLINPGPGDRDLPECKQKLVDAGPSFVRSTLALSERKKREYETWQKIEMEDAFRQERRAAKYSYDVFLSYSARDRAIALPIRDKLHSVGARVFMAPKSLEPGDDFAAEIRQALHGSAEVWVIMSPNSLNSEWVTTEWGAAWVLDKRTVPILHRCDIPQLPERLKRLHCVDAGDVTEMIKKKFKAPEGVSDDG